MSENPSFWSTMTEHLEIAQNLRHLQIHFKPDRCTGDWFCYEVCPVNCWWPDRERHKAVFQTAERCIACGACVLQCPHDAIELKKPR